MDDDLDTKKDAWLAAFAVEGTVVGACKASEVPRSTAYLWRQKDESFAVAWADLEQATTERMEREAYRRGVEGVPRDVYHQGQVVGSERQFSDTLLIFMLKARVPEKYRDNVHVHHAGELGMGAVLVADRELAGDARTLLRSAAGAGGDVAGGAGGSDQ